MTASVIDKGVEREIQREKISWHPLTYFFGARKNPSQMTLEPWEPEVNDTRSSRPAFSEQGFPLIPLWLFSKIMKGTAESIDFQASIESLLLFPVESPNVNSHTTVGTRKL